MDIGKLYRDLGVDSDTLTGTQHVRQVVFEEWRVWAMCEWRGHECFAVRSMSPDVEFEPFVVDTCPPPSAARQYLDEKCWLLPN